MNESAKLHVTTDAIVWASEFKKINPEADEELMFGWFANAIMAGFDEGMRRGYRKRKDEEAKEFAEMVAGLTPSIDEINEDVKAIREELAAKTKPSCSSACVCNCCGSGTGGPLCKSCRAGIAEGARREMERVREVIEQHETGGDYSQPRRYIVGRALRRDLGIDEEVQQ